MPKGRKRREPPAGAPERLAVFHVEFREDPRWWTREQPRVVERVWALIEEVDEGAFYDDGEAAV